MKTAPYSSAKASAFLTYRNCSIALALTIGISGCASTSAEPPNLTIAQAEYNREYAEQIEAKGRAQQREDRMGEAEATEMATRHAPSNVSTTTVLAPRF